MRSSVDSCPGCLWELWSRWNKPSNSKEMEPDASCQEQNPSSAEGQYAVRYLDISAQHRRFGHIFRREKGVQEVGRWSERAGGLETWGSCHFFCSRIRQEVRTLHVDVFPCFMWSSSHHSLIKDTWTLHNFANSGDLCPGCKLICLTSTCRPSC